MSVTDRFNELQPRERRLVLALGGCVVVFVLVLLPLGASTLLSEKQEQKALLQLAIKRFRAESGKLVDREAEHVALLRRYRKPAPALAGFLDKTATATSIEIPEIKDRSPISHGKKYEERPTSISLKKVGLLNLVKFMEKVSGSQHPIGITQLDIRKRRDAPDSYDAQLVVAAYHRLAKKSAAGSSEANKP